MKLEKSTRKICFLSWYLRGSRGKFIVAEGCNEEKGTCSEMERRELGIHPRAQGLAQALAGVELWVTAALRWEEGGRVEQSTSDIPTSLGHFRTSTRLRETIRKIRRAKNKILNNAGV